MTNGKTIALTKQVFVGIVVSLLSGIVIKNLPAMQETWVQSLDREDPLKEKMASHSAWRIPMDRGAWWATVHEVAKSQT